MNLKSKHSQKTHQRWINVETKLMSTLINVVLTVIFGWKWKFSRRTFIDVISKLAKQCWSSVNRITLLQRRWTSLVSIFELTHVCRLSFNVDKTLLKQRWKNYVDSILMTQCCFNVDIWLKRKVESTYVHHCCFHVEQTELKELCQYLLCSCLLESASITKQN